jgi:hemin uptake protein HemP
MSEDYTSIIDGLPYAPFKQSRYGGSVTIHHDGEDGVYKVTVDGKEMSPADFVKLVRERDAAASAAG